ncbi:SDR family NAD(P)-dependent oxidoreductase [Paenibacillus sp. P26]|nr:SDR family NAD(P)-dependent oxidoreductase [Paenibacillus sp. P26]
MGKAWSEYMVRTYKAQIVWIGRRPLDDGIRTEAQRIAAFGPEPRYISADAADFEAFREAYQAIKSRYSRIDGIVHSAMVLTDTSLADMDEKQFRAGLSAKVDVSVRVAQVFREEPLDFVLFFSSLIALIKNPRQSHYASGCTFKDAFAHRLAAEWPCKVKIMNWGYWSSEDAASSDDVKQLVRIGMGLIEPEAGMGALEVLVSGPADQLAMITTTKPLVVEGMNPTERVALLAGSGPSFIQTVSKHIPDRSGEIHVLKRGMNRHRKMADLLSRLLLGELSSMGAFGEKAVSAKEAGGRIGLAPLYGRWFEESIRSLVQSGFLTRDGVSYRLSEGVLTDREALWNEWELRQEEWLHDSSLRAWMVLAGTVLRALPDILTGRKLATDLLFPDSSMRMVEGIYKTIRLRITLTRCLRIRRWLTLGRRITEDPSARIRIIEIGAGTGGTSDLLFRELKPYQAHIEEYCYTDISKAFLLFAEKEYGPDNPYLTYKMFNVEAPSSGSRALWGEFDVAVATNVLHATRNIRQTLRNAKAVLKNNGIVLINELSRHSLFTHLTFGLLEGWWLYEDEALRIPGCPGLTPETWQEVLESEGYRSVYFPAEEAHELGQQIIAAESNGVVRTAPNRRTVWPEASAKSKAASLSGRNAASRERSVSDLPAQAAPSNGENPAASEAYRLGSSNDGQVCEGDYHK